MNEAAENLARAMRRLLRSSCVVSGIISGGENKIAIDEAEKALHRYERMTLTLRSDNSSDRKETNETEAKTQ